MATTRHAIDRTIHLDVNGSRQRIRLCADREGRPPLLIVQGGPGLPLLHEVPKFQRLLDLERDFLVGYWEQRGCGDAPRHEAERVSLQRQVADLRIILKWLAEQTKQRVIVLGISLGGTFALQAVEHELNHAKAVIVVSPDSHTAISDASAEAFLQAQRADAASRGVRRRIGKLAKPPYLDSAALQRRASVLADLGTIERGKTFAALLREMLVGVLRTYGLAGATRAWRNLNVVQRRMLPELASLDLLADPPRVAVPVHYVFGEQDALNPLVLVHQLPAAIAAPVTTVNLVPNAGHMVHFDHPDVVRSIVVNA